MRYLNPVKHFRMEKVAVTNIEQVIVWKNGIFNFHGKNIQEVMRQLSRWYNIEVSYKGKPPVNIFYGKMGKSAASQKSLNFLKNQVFMLMWK